MDILSLCEELDELRIAIAEEAAFWDQIEADSQQWEDENEEPADTGYFEF